MGGGTRIGFRADMAGLSGRRLARAVALRAAKHKGDIKKREMSVGGWISLSARSNLTLARSKVLRAYLLTLSGELFLPLG